MRARLIASFTAVAVLATLLATAAPVTASDPPEPNWGQAQTLQVSSPLAAKIQGSQAFVSDDARFIAYSEDRIPRSSVWGVRPVAVVWDSATRTTTMLDTPLNWTAWSEPKAISADGFWVVVYDVYEGLFLVPNLAAGNTGATIAIEASVNPVSVGVTNDGAVAFITNSGLVPGDSYGVLHYDVYLWEPARDSNGGPVAGTSTLELLTADSNGTALGASRGEVAVTGDGLQVAHLHTGDGLGGVPPGTSNLYVWDRTNGHQHIGAAQASMASAVDMSSAGRFVASDVPGGSQLWDRGPGGAGPVGPPTPITEPGTGRSGRLAAISNDGRFAVTTLQFPEPGRPSGIWLRDLNYNFDDSRAFTLVNHHWSQPGVAGTHYGPPDISGDGTVVSYHSYSNQLVANDSSTDADVFTWWRTGLPGFQLPPGRSMGPHAPTPPAAHGGVGDPVNSFTGAYYDTVSDLSSPAQGVHFELTRDYDSSDIGSGMFGRGWAGSYDMRLRADGGTVAMLFGNREAASWTSSAGAYESQHPTIAQLEPNGSGWRMTWPDGRRASFDEKGHLESLCDRRGVGLSFTTTPHGTPATATDAAGRVHIFTHDTTGRLTNISSPDGRNVSYGYNTEGLLESVTDVRGSTTTYTYDDAGRLLTEVDANGHTVVDNVYGPDGRVTSNTEAPGITHHYAWDEVTRTSTWTDGRGNNWVDVYDAVGRLTSRTNPEGGVTKFTYDDMGMVATIADANGAVTTFARDTSGRVVEQSGPVPGETLEWSYNADGSLASHTDGDGHVTEFTYTGGLLTRIDHPDETFEAFTHHPGTTLVAAHTNAAGETTLYDYDPAGNLTEVTSPAGRVTAFTYDAAGRVVSRVDPAGNVAGADPDEHRWAFTWDPAGNPLTVTSPEGRVSGFSYDDVGNRLTATTAKGTPLESSTGWTYDEGNWPIAVTEATGGTTSWVYDDAGNREHRVDGTGRDTTFTFDDANRLSTETAPSGASSTVNVDGLGRPTRVVPAGTRDLAPAAAPSYTAVTPARIFDSRTGGGARLPANTDTAVPVTGVGGVPAGGVAAVAVNLTVTQSTAGGFLRAFRNGATPTPTPSVLNFKAGQTIATMAVVEVDANGMIALRPSTATHVVVDVTGWFPIGGAYTPITPTRAHNDRATTQPTRVGDRDVAVTGVAGVPSTGVAAVAVHLTVTDGAAPGYATVFEHGVPRPAASTLNYAAGQTIANAAIVPVSPDGKVTAYTNSVASVIVDVVGWFADNGEYHPVAAHRSFDSRRAGDGPAIGPGGNDRLVTLTGAGGVPGTGVAAVAMNVTVANPSANGYLVIYPGDVDPADRPTVSLLNYAANQAPQANATIATVGLVGVDGTIRIYASGATHVIVDVVGWFAEPPAPVPQPAGVNYTHDPAGRVTAIGFDDPSTPDVAYTYDGRGLRTSMVDGRGTTTYTHDEMGRLLEVTGPDGVFGYTYDDAGRVTTRSLPDGRTLTYTHDLDGHITSVTDGTRTTSYTWDLNGNLSSITSPNGAVETRGYDNDGHLIAQTVTSDAVTLVDKVFTVDPAGRVTRTDDTRTTATHPVITYRYDAAGRLLEECHQATCEDPADPFTRWTYDHAGRRTTETTPAGVTTYTYDTDGNLATTTGPAGTTTYTHDAAGRRTAETNPTAGARSYTWDAAGRLASVTDAAGTTVFTYTGDGARAAASGPDGDVALLWDLNGALPQPVTVTVDDGATTLEQAFAWGPNGAPAWAGIDDGTGAALQVVHTDQVWNPTVHTDAAGAVTHTVMGDAWGNHSTITTVNTAAPAPALGHSSVPAAAAVDGLVHLRARDYDPGTGQFLTPDPWVRPDGQPWVGVHSYTDGNPVTFWDPTGLRGEGGACRVGWFTLGTWANGNGGSGCKGGTFWFGDGCSYACWAATGTTVVLGGAMSGLVCTGTLGLGCGAALFATGSATAAVRHATTEKTSEGLLCSSVFGGVGGLAGGAGGEAVGKVARRALNPQTADIAGSTSGTAISGIAGNAAKEGLC